MTRRNRSEWPKMFIHVLLYLDTEPDLVEVVPNCWDTRLQVELPGSGGQWGPERFYIEKKNFPLKQWRKCMKFSQETFHDGECDYCGGPKTPNPRVWYPDLTCDDCRKRHREDRKKRKAERDAKKSEAARIAACVNSCVNRWDVCG